MPETRPALTVMRLLLLPSTLKVRPAAAQLASGAPVITGDPPLTRSCRAPMMVTRLRRRVASAIALMIDDEKLRTELRRKGLERARTFSWRKTAQLTLKAYEQAMKRKK